MPIWPWHGVPSHTTPFVMQKPSAHPLRHCRLFVLLLLAGASSGAERDAARQPEPLAVPKPLPRSPGTLPFALPPLEAEPPSANPRQGAWRRVKQVVFHGNTVITTQELQKVADPYLGRQLYDSDVEALRRALTLAYIERGYVNSGALLETGSADGQDVLTFRIVEGKVTRFQIRGLERLAEEYVTGRLVPKPDAPLNLDALRERFQLLLDDPLFSRINTRLIPGENAGDAILDLDVVRARPYQLTAFVNNYRSPSIGEIAVGLHGNVRNLTGYGDLLDFSWQQTTESQHSDSYSLGWRLPVNRHDTTLSLRAEAGRSIVVEAPLNQLDITSKVRSVDIGISQPVLETLSHKFSVGLNHVEQTVKSTLLGQGFSFTPGVPAGVTDTRMWRFWQEYAYRSASNVFVVRSTFSSQTNNNEAQAVPGIGQAPSHYRYWLGQFQYTQLVGESGMQAIVKGVLQRANTKLLPVDALSIGGLNTVRGYRENQLLGDKGMVLSAQLDVPMWREADRHPLVVAGPFYDWGRATRIGADTKILSSFGLAMRATWKGARLDAAYAIGRRHDIGLDNQRGSLQDHSVHVQLAYDFF
jgi:hemolysin activation/secretion protein